MGGAACLHIRDRRTSLGKIIYVGTPIFTPHESSDAWGGGGRGGGSEEGGEKPGGLHISGSHPQTAEGCRKPPTNHLGYFKCPIGIEAVRRGLNKQHPRSHVVAYVKGKVLHPLEEEPQRASITCGHRLELRTWQICRWRVAISIRDFRRHT